MENATEAIIMAPFFVCIEFLFIMGFRPLLKRRVQERIRGSLNTRKLRIERRLLAHDAQSGSFADRQRAD